MAAENTVAEASQEEQRKSSRAQFVFVRAFGNRVLVSRFSVGRRDELHECTYTRASERRR
jgi:hypothetical protein